MCSIGTLVTNKGDIRSDWDSHQDIPQYLSLPSCRYHPQSEGQRQRRWRGVDPEIDTFMPISIPNIGQKKTNKPDRKPSSQSVVHANQRRRNIDGIPGMILWDYGSRIDGYLSDMIMDSSMVDCMKSLRKHSNCFFRLFGSFLCLRLSEMKEEREINCERPMIRGETTGVK